MPTDYGINEEIGNVLRFGSAHQEAGIISSKSVWETKEQNFKSVFNPTHMLIR